MIIDHPYFERMSIIVRIISFILTLCFILMIPNLIFNNGYNRFPIIGLIQLIKEYGYNIPIIYIFSGLGVLLLAQPLYLLLINNEPSKKYGKARFATIWDFKKLGLNLKNGNQVLGKRNNKIIYAGKHLSTIIFAPPGTGKSSGFIIPTLLTSPNSMVIFDIKGELEENTAQDRMSFSKIYIFAPHRIDSCIFNVFCKSLIPNNPDYLQNYIRNVSNIIVASKNDTNNNFFYNRARELFTTLIGYLINKHGSTSLPDLLVFTSSGEKLVSIIRTITQEENIAEWIRESAFDLLNDADAKDQWAGIIATLAQTLYVFRFENIKKICSGYNTVNHQRLISEDKPITLYIQVATEDIDTYAPLMTLIFSTLSDRLLSINPTKNRRYVTFLLDEFSQLSKIDKLVKLPSLSRSYKINVIYCVQDLTQIIDKYSQELAKTLVNNCSYRIVLNQNDLDTAELISKIIGKFTDQKKSKSFGRNNKSTSISDEGLSLVTAQELLSMNNNDCIILSDRDLSLPIKAKIPFWFKNKKLLGIN